VASFEFLSKYLLIMLLRLDKILYSDLGNEILDRAISNVHAGRRFPPCSTWLILCQFY